MQEELFLAPVVVRPGVVDRNEWDFLPGPQGSQRVCASYTEVKVQFSANFNQKPQETSPNFQFSTFNIRRNISSILNFNHKPQETSPNLKSDFQRGL